LQKYETIFVIDSLLKAEEIEAIITKYERFISANGGDINAIEKWGKKRLAYEIKKRQYGYYVLIRFDGPGAMIKQLEREYRLNESILRFMTLAMTKMALKVLESQQALAPAEESKKAEEPKKVEEPVAEEPKKEEPEAKLEEAVEETPVEETPEAPKEEASTEEEKTEE
jgi:small subunit ribosomal protein S6